MEKRSSIDDDGIIKRVIYKECKEDDNIVGYERRVELLKLFKRDRASSNAIASRREWTRFGAATAAVGPERGITMNSVDNFDIEDPFGDEAKMTGDERLVERLLTAVKSKGLNREEVVYNPRSNSNGRANNSSSNPRSNAGSPSNRKKNNGSNSNGSRNRPNSPSQMPGYNNNRSQSPAFFRNNKGQQGTRTDSPSGAKNQKHRNSPMKHNRHEIHASSGSQRHQGAKEAK